MDNKRSVYNRLREEERPIPEDIYPVIDNDLARDNIENDIPYADLDDPDQLYL